MRLRHNKKRNTAFLYEILIREMAKSTLTSNHARRYKIITLIKEHFSGNTELAKELRLYKPLYESKEMKPQIAEKLIQEAKRSHEKIDREQVFLEQSVVISKINKALSKQVFSNFVPNYKNLATIAQIFDFNVPIKNRVLLEANLLEKIISTKEKSNKVPISNLAYKTFVKKFNEEYNNKLLEEQKKLLNNYVLSFVDNGISLKLFLNEEISRLKKVIYNTPYAKEIKSDKAVTEKINKTLSLIENFKNKPINKEMLEQILKIQNLAKEMEG